MTTTRQLREIEIEVLRQAIEAGRAACPGEEFEPPGVPFAFWRGVFNGVLITLALIVCLIILPIAITLSLEAFVP